MKNNIHLTKANIISFLKKECVLIIASLLAIITSFFSPFKLSYINFKVLILLFNLMIVIGAFRKLRILDSLALFLLKKCKSMRSVNFALVFITFFISMIVTNDVSLLTFVPLTIILADKSNANMMNTIILETIAANIGSSLTPVGNPQNLYIYTKYNINTVEFINITGRFVFLGGIILILLILFQKNKKINVSIESIEICGRFKPVLYLFLLMAVIGSVFNIIDYKLVFALIIIIVIILDRDLFLQVDYSLIFTFITFFIFVGNISNMEFIKDFMKNILSTSKSTYIASIFSSQIISNVPATMLVTGFSNKYKEILLGVNIGGLGTIIASLASLISYKFYCSSNMASNFSKSKDKKSSKEYLIKFSIYNFILLLIFTVFFVTIM